MNSVRIPNAALLTVALAAALAAPAFGVVAGDPAPDWTLNAFGGGSHTLSDYQGKVVMMFVVGYG